jgi:hypothetical protein
MNVRPVIKGVGQAVLDALEAIWPDMFVRKYAVTIVCERCSRPYTYWVKQIPNKGQMRRCCDSCVHY